MKPLPNLALRAAFAAFVFSALPAAAATLMVNFSSVASNDITSVQATTLGLDFANVQNVRTGTGAAGGTTASISLGGITGSVVYADYWQSSMLTNLGQPYATVVGGRQIGATGNQAVISLTGFSAWMTANSYTGYQVLVYYAGQTLGSENLATTPNTVSFTTGSGTVSDVIAVGAHGTSSAIQWSGTGTLQSFTDDTLTITSKYIDNQPHGIAAIRIIGVPEPSAALLGGIGLLCLGRRRRR